MTTKSHNSQKIQVEINSALTLMIMPLEYKNLISQNDFSENQTSFQPEATGRVTKKDWYPVLSAIHVYSRLLNI